MIITQKKPLEEVLALVGEAKTVAVIGCGLCAETCPEVFSLRDDGFAEAAPGPVPESAQETAAEAMDACPTSAIEEG